MSLDKSPEYFMARALELARTAYSIGEIPVGCVITDEEGNLIAEGYNRTISDNDPTAHAEIVALRAAGVKLSNYRLPLLNLYVTLEPCCMCSGAIIHSRIKSVFYGASDPKTGACGSVFNVLNDARHNHTVMIQGGIMADECSEILSKFFKERREYHRRVKALKAQSETGNTVKSEDNAKVTAEETAEDSETEDKI